jgi:hypothetical protein
MSFGGVIMLLLLLLELPDDSTDQSELSLSEEGELLSGSISLEESYSEP